MRKLISVLVANQLLFATMEYIVRLVWFGLVLCEGAHTENTPYIALHCTALLFHAAVVCVCAPYRERFEACN